MDLQGSCLCGAVRYRVTGEVYHVCDCHCTECRGSSGAPFLAWGSVHRDGFAWTHGRPRTYASAPSDTRSFCGACGTQLTFATTRWPDEVDFTIASLAEPDALRPTDEIWTRSRIVWVPPVPGADQHVTHRGAGAAPG